MKRSLLAGLILTGFAWTSVAWQNPQPKSRPGPNKADEPKRKIASPEKAAEFLDQVSLSWTTNRKCGTCHTNVPHLMARATLKVKASDEEQQVRRFFEERVTHWDRGQKGDKPRWDTEVLVTAVTLALHDAGTTGKLNATTRTALDRMWTLQKKHGAWDWLKCEWPPMEHDDYFGAVFVAVGVGAAPQEYAKTEKAKAGLEKLRGYFQKTPAPNLHHRAWLLWASLRIDGVMDKEGRDKTVKDVLAVQKVDGGWSLPSLGDWKGHDGRENDLAAPSDGYATGLMVYVLRQAGVPRDDVAITKGVAWLKNNQRESGRWFTPSLNSNGAHYITHAGTAFALMALKACE